MALSLRRLPFRRSLIRPFLLAGGERSFVLSNVTLMACLLLGVGLTKFTLMTAGLLATLGQWDWCKQPNRMRRCRRCICGIFIIKIFIQRNPVCRPKRRALPHPYQLKVLLCYVNIAIKPKAFQIY